MNGQAECAVNARTPAGRLGTSRQGRSFLQLDIVGIGARTQTVRPAPSLNCNAAQASMS